MRTQTQTQTTPCPIAVHHIVLSTKTKNVAPASMRKADCHRIPAVTSLSNAVNANTSDGGACRTVS